MTSKIQICTSKAVGSNVIDEICNLILSVIAISTLIFCNIVVRGLLIYFCNMCRNERRPRGQPRAIGL